MKKKLLTTINSSGLRYICRTHNTITALCVLTPGLTINLLTMVSLYISILRLPNPFVLMLLRTWGFWGYIRFCISIIILLCGRGIDSKFVNESHLDCLVDLPLISQTCPCSPWPTASKWNIRSWVIRSSQHLYKFKMKYFKSKSLFSVVYFLRTLPIS